MKYYYRIQDRETGTMIIDFETFDAAKKQLAAYENEDKNDGIFTPDFYEIALYDAAGDFIESLY